MAAPLPLGLYVLVGISVYLLDGFVAYRIFTEVSSAEGRAVSATALVTVMVMNALWNYAFFEFRSPLIGLLGVIAFVGPVVVLQVSLFMYDEVAGWAHSAYTAFVIGYDLPLFYAIWRLNPDPPAPRRNPLDEGMRTAEACEPFASGSR